MIVGEPWGLAALAALPVLAGLHLWRARHAPRRITGLFLWPDRHRALAAGRRRTPLVLRTSFWCEVAAILAATWWLADLHWTPRGPARHLVVVLDDRWRMQAAAGGESAAARLRQALAQRLAALDQRDRVTLLASGAPPRLLAGPAAEPSAAGPALAAWLPQSAWHDLDTALALAATLGGAGAEVVVASDRIPAALPRGVGALATGAPGASSGFADLRWWRDAGPERIVAAVYGAGPAERTLRLAIGGIVIAQRTVAAGATIDLALPPGLAEGAEAVVALDGDDALPLDDVGRLVRPAARTVRCLVAPDAPLAAPAAAALASAGAIVDAGGADLCIGAAATAPGAWSFTIAPGPGPPAIGPFTGRSEHPLLHDLDFTGALWAGAGEPGDASPLLISGDGVLLAERRRGADRDLMLHLDPARSDLARHPAWPGLFANLVAWRRSLLPGLAEPNPRCGQAFTAVLPPGTREALLVDPAGGQRTLRADLDGVLAVPGLPRPGRWRLGAGSWSQELAVLPLDARQGDLAEAATGERAATPVGRAEVDRRRGPLETLLPLLACAIAAGAAWAAFAREERR